MGGLEQGQQTSSCVAPPDYLKDLNAMHEAEKVLNDDQWSTYADLLRLECGHCFRLAAATAKQRAEAFLKTLNLWQPTTPTPKD